MKKIINNVIQLVVLAVAIGLTFWMAVSAFGASPSFQQVTNIHTFISGTNIYWDKVGGSNRFSVTGLANTTNFSGSLATGPTNTVLAANGITNYFTGSPTVTNLSIPATTSPTVGVINQDSFSLIHNFRIASTFGNNIFVGKGAGNFTLTGSAANEQGSYLTAIGDYALTNNTTGGRNTAIGFNALNRNTSGGSSVAVGSDALRSQTTGGANIAIGNSAMSANIDGAFNTAVGDNALDLHITGDNNVAIGGNALYHNTNGYSNVAIGYQALETSMADGWNVAIGYQALQASIVGNNTAVGTYALKANTTGPANTALGMWALFNNTIGGNNVAIGQEALRPHTDGWNNIAIGYRALYTNTLGTSDIAIGFMALPDLDLPTVTGGPGYNIGIGYRAGSGIVTGTNNVIIGNFITGGFSADTHDTIIIADGQGRQRLGLGGDRGGIEYVADTYRPTNLFHAWSGTATNWVTWNNAGIMTLSASNSISGTTNAIWIDVLMTGGGGATIPDGLVTNNTAGPVNIATNSTLTTSNLTASGNLTTEGSVLAKGANHAFGTTATLPYIGMRITSTIIAHSAPNIFLAGVDLDPTITALDSFQYATYLNVAGFGITTPPNTNSGIISSVRITEPNITLGTNSTLAEAYTLYVAGQPTEAAINYALHISGDSWLSGRLDAGGRDPIIGTNSSFKFIGDNYDINGTYNSYGTFYVGAGAPMAINVGGSIGLGGLNGSAQYAFAKITGKKENSSADLRGYLSFEVANDSSIPEKMRISSTGNVGIGTNAPSERLEINGNFRASGTVTASGFVSTASNTLALASISFPNTTVNWTNTFGINIFLFIDNAGVTGTALKINGTQISSTLVVTGDTMIPLQPGDYFSETYTIGTPVAVWKPQ